MIEWQGWVVIAYLAVFAVGAILSFVLSKSDRRTWIRVITSVLFVPVLFVVFALLILISPLLRRTPTLAELQNDFDSKRRDLELLVHMSDKDVTFTRIARTFVDHPSNPNELGRYSEGDPRALPETRWDEYRKIYSRIGVDLGIQRDLRGDAFIMMDSYGMLGSGRTSGYVFCRPDNSTDHGPRFPPCLSQRYKGERKMNAKDRKGYSFLRIAANWYAYIDESG